VQPHSTVLNTDTIEVLGTILIWHYTNMVCSLGAETVHMGPLHPFFGVIVSSASSDIMRHPRAQARKDGYGHHKRLFPSRNHWCWHMSWGRQRRGKSVLWLCQFASSSVCLGGCKIPFSTRHRCLGCSILRVSLLVGKLLLRGVSCGDKKKIMYFDDAFGI